MSLEKMLEALDEALSSGGQTDEVVRALFFEARSAGESEKNDLLASLDIRIRSYPPERIVCVAMLAGALVELGADVQKFPLSVFDHMLAHLDLIQGAEDETELPESYYALERAAIACLSRSAELRKNLPQKPFILAKLVRYQERYGFLGKMLQVLDDEPLLVLHPKARRGFRCMIHGVADNFQLHVLLLGALEGKGVNGQLQSREALAAASDASEPSEATAQSDWQLVNWFGLRTGMVDHESWIWNEGVPADIATFDGLRVVLIDTSKIQRSWDAQRVFPGMIGRLANLVVLENAEADRLLNELELRARA